jgi:hypothetical protein
MPCLLPVWPLGRTASAAVVSKPNDNRLVIHDVALSINCCVKMERDHGLPLIYGRYYRRDDMWAPKATTVQPLWCMSSPSVYGLRQAIVFPRQLRVQPPRFYIVNASTPPTTLPHGLHPHLSRRPA